MRIRRGRRLTAPRELLLAEDNSTDVLLVQRAVRRMSIEARLHVVRDGEEVIAYLRGSDGYADRMRHPLPGVLLLDLKLPRQSGFDVLSWIRGQTVLRRLPVVVLTSSRQTPDVNRAFDLGANSYLVKPVDALALADMMQAVGTYWLGRNEYPEVD